jgi:CRISPR/Cas system-associated exonuclease Cas4 (RecB family)
MNSTTSTSETKPINLSHTRAAKFCGRQIYYDHFHPETSQSPWIDNFYTACGHIYEAGVNAELKNRMTGVQGCGIREEMQKVMDDLTTPMDWELAEKVREEFPKAVTSVEKYINGIDYTPVRVQEWFNFHLDGEDENPVVGCVDIIAERDGLPLIIDLKRKSSKLKRDNYDYRMQVSLYALWLMQARELDEIPKAEIHVMLSGANPQIWPVDISAEDMYEAVERLRDLAWRLKHKYFPMARGQYLCSPRWCEYWDQCHIDSFKPLDSLLNDIKP